MGAKKDLEASALTRPQPIIAEQIEKLKVHIIGILLWLLISFSSSNQLKFILYISCA